MVLGVRTAPLLDILELLYTSTPSSGTWSRVKTKSSIEGVGVMQKAKQTRSLGSLLAKGGSSALDEIICWTGGFKKFCSGDPIMLDADRPDVET